MSLGSSRTTHTKAKSQNECINGFNIMQEQFPSSLKVLPQRPSTRTKH